MKFMKKFYLLVFLVFAGVIQGCSVNMNSRLLKMDEGQEFWITDIIPQDEGELIILQGDLSKSKFYEHCKKIKSIQAFNHWDIALLVINKSGTGNVYMIYPYYNSLDTLNLKIKIDQGTRYDINSIRIKRTEGNYFEIYEAGKNQIEVIINNNSSNLVYLDKCNFRGLACSCACIDEDKKINEYLFSLSPNMSANFSHAYYDFTYQLDPGASVVFYCDEEKIKDDNCYKVSEVDIDYDSSDENTEVILTLEKTKYIKTKIGKAAECIYTYYVSSKPLPQGTIPDYTENIKKYGIKLSGTFSSNKLIFEVNEKITGKVIEKGYYGPPNYGETPELDAKEIETIICFDEPKNFFVDEKLAVIKEMQLVFYKSFYKDSDCIPGKRYSFTGRVVPAETGHHHTDYILLVDNYNLEENQIE